MNTSLYVETKALPICITSVLTELGYHKKDIPIKIKDKVCLSISPYKGNRGVVVIINLSTGESRKEYGSFGGRNIFENTPVDVDNNEYMIPPNCSIVMGEIGGAGTFLSVIVSPNNVNKFLPEHTSTPLTSLEIDCLAIYRGYKPAYRKDMLKRKGISEDIVNKLVSEGYLNSNKVGISITTKGKNASKGRFV